MILNLTLDGFLLPVLPSVSDLGVLSDPNLKFDQHIRTIVCKGHYKANLIRRSFLTRHHATLINTFNIYVRPALEYASSVWSPNYIGIITLIEGVQRRFTKRLFGIFEFCYGDRLILLKLHTIEYRRHFLNLCLCYKVLHGLVALDPDDFFQAGSELRRGHRYKLA